MHRLSGATCSGVAGKQDPIQFVWEGAFLSVLIPTRSPVTAEIRLIRNQIPISGTFLCPLCLL